MKINIKNLTKYYDKKILDNINLDLKEIHSIGIIGESGCGKSTLLRQLAAIEYPDEGTISINDIEIVEKNKKIYQDKIGYVFQKHNLFPHLSIKDNITLILSKVKKAKKEDAEKIAEEILKKMHLEDQMYKKPNKISGGQAQRASIARALSTDPEILFLDEPTAALDPILTGEVLNAINELKESGKDFIFVTHEIAFLKSFADYMIFMDKGKIVEHGYIGHLENPKSENLRKFLKGTTVE
jgi:polar amino acid transport system ATP-binding protein